MREGCFRACYYIVFVIMRLKVRRVMPCLLLVLFFLYFAIRIEDMAMLLHGYL